MKRHRLMILSLIAMLAILVAAPVIMAKDDRDDRDNGFELRATLRGFEEVPATSTGASGSFRGQISADETTITYILSYSGLEGEVRQSHIHFGQRGVAGGIVVFLCQTTSNPDPTGHAPACPQSGTVGNGPVSFTAANMVSVGNPPAQAAAQGISPGQFAEFVRAIRAGVTYVNVHSAGTGVPVNFAGGEIRGQIRAADDHDR